MRTIAVVLAALAVAGYLVLHSPLRSLIAQVIHLRSDTCYFTCLAQVGAQPLVEAASGLMLLVAAALAARASTQDLEGVPADRILGFALTWIAFVTVPAGFVGGAGFLLGEPLLRPPLGPVLAAIPSAIVVFVVVRSHRGWRTLKAPSVRPTALLIWLASVAGSLLTAALTVRLTHPTSSYDALSYHAPLSALLWRGGDLGSFLLPDPSYWSLAHPGTAELWSGLLHVIGGDTLALFSQVPFAILGAVAVACIARRTGLRDPASTIGGLAYLIVPLLAMQLGTQLNDVVGAGIFLATAALLSAPSRGWSMGRVLLVVLGLGLVTTTKLALLPAVAALGVILLVGMRWPRDNRGAKARRPDLRVLTSAAVVFGLIVLPWWGRNLAMYGNPLYPVDFPIIGGGFDQTLLGLKDSEFVPFPTAWLIYPLIEAHSEYSGLGPLFVLALFGCLAFVLRTKRRGGFALPALVWAVTLPAWWLLTRHEPRFLLGPVGLLLAFTPWTLVALGRARRTVVSVGIAAIAAASALITLTSAVAPLAAEPTDRTAFYDDVWGVLPAAMTLPASQGLLWEYGCASTTYPAFLPILTTPQRGSTLRTVVPIDCLASATAIVDRMRETGVRYAYVMVSPELRSAVEGKHPAGDFAVEASDTIQSGRLAGTARYLFHLVSAP